MFDSFCKHVIKNALRNELRKLLPRLHSEMLVADLVEYYDDLMWEDQYSSDYFLENIQGYTWAVSDITSYRAMNTLPKEQRLILALSYWYAYSDVEIARIMGIPRSTIGYRRNAAIREIRKILRGKSSGIDV